MTCVSLSQKGGYIMGILLIGIGLLIGIHIWIERSETFHEWADYQEQLRFKQEQEKRSLMNERYFLE
jgi:hypothetical protein